MLPRHVKRVVNSCIMQADEGGNDRRLVYHTGRPPPFTARSALGGTSRGSICDSLYLLPVFNYS